MIRILWAVTFAIAFFANEIPAEEISFVSTDGRMKIRIGDAPLATYVYDDPALPRPYFCDVFAPNGVQVTRNHPPDPVSNKDNDDHPTFHPGIWLAFGDINGEDFWRNKARVRHLRFVEPPQGSDGTATFTVENRYEAAGDASKPVCMERCTYTIDARPDGYYLLVESTFWSPDSTFVFGDQEEMGLGVRINTPFTVEHGNGRIINSEGGVNEAGTWGRVAEWCSYFGEENGARIGVTIMPDPANFRRAWFHNRDYGVFAANPFGEKAMTGAGDDSIQASAVRVEKGENFALGFGVRIFSEPSSSPFDGSAAYETYVSLLALR